MKKKLKDVIEGLSAVIKLEFLYKNRQKDALLYSISSLIIFGCFLYSQWPNDESAIFKNWGNYFYSLMLIYLIIISSLITTPYASILISTEKEKKTLILLKTADLTNFEIIFGKILSNLYFMFFLILPFLPFILICPLLNDITYITIFEGILIWFIITFYFTTFGVFISTLFKKNYFCISLAFLITFVSYFGFILLDNILNIQFYTYTYYFYSDVFIKYFSSFSLFDAINEYFIKLNNPIVDYSFSLYPKIKYAFKPNYLIIFIIYFLISILLIIFNTLLFKSYKITEA